MYLMLFPYLYICIIILKGALYFVEHVINVCIIIQMLHFKMDLNLRFKFVNTAQHHHVHARLLLKARAKVPYDDDNDK